MNKLLLLTFALLLLLTATALAADEPAALSSAMVLNTTQASAQKPVVAVLPVINRSGMAEKYAKVALQTIDERLDKKFADKYAVLPDADVEKAVKETTFENYDSPVLAELVAVGKKLGADYVTFIGLEPHKGDGTGFAAGVGSSKIKVWVTMKAKYVDVKEGKYIVNQVISDAGTSSAITLGMFGGVSPKNAVLGGTNKVMDTFLSLF